MDVGINAIDQQLRKLHGSLEGTVLRSLLPLEVDPHPCKMVGAWPVSGPRPHWHLVTYGLTELFDKESEIIDQSGWGHELTMRVPRTPDEDGPPRWAVELLRSLVQYVYATGHSFGVDHFVPLEGRFGRSKLAGATFTRDPSLPDTVETLNGRMHFLQLVGLTQDELNATMRTNDRRVVAALLATDALMMTDPRRLSVFTGPNAPEFPPEPVHGLEGAASAALNEVTFVRQFTGWWELGLPRQEVPQVAEALGRRLARSQQFTLASPDQRVLFVPGEAAGWERAENGDVLVHVSPELAEDLKLALALPATDEARELPSLPEVRVRW